MSDSEGTSGADRADDAGVVPDNPVSNQPAVNIRYPERAQQALTAVVGHDVSLRMVDAGATALAAFEGSQDATGDAYLEAVDLAARSGMPADEREIAAIVEQNGPLPEPADFDEGGDGAAAVLVHTLKLAVDHVGQHRLQP